MAKSITVVGTGYVGLITSVGLADFGNRVAGVDLRQDIVDQLSQGKPHIYEPGVEEYLKRNLETGRLRFQTDLAAAAIESEVVFLAVGTPQGNDGAADLSYVEAAVLQLARAFASAATEGKTWYVVTKSTVPVGTNRWISGLFAQHAPEASVVVVSNPEFLREGKATHDFFHPDRVVLGADHPSAFEVMEDIYRPLYLISVPFVTCNLETAELIKYAANAFLATKIAFINQVANLADAVGADIHQVAKSMGMDGRISPKFLHPGPGYGGSCFPKDTVALMDIGKKNGVSMDLISAVVQANEYQKTVAVSKLRSALTGSPEGDISSRTVALLGLAFKQETDDIRESPAIAMVKSLLQAGVHIHAHDPKAIENFSKLFEPGNHGTGSIKYCSSSADAAANADALIVATEWNEYRSLDLLAIKAAMAGNVIVDARNLLSAQEARGLGFNYQGMGRGSS